MLSPRISSPNLFIVSSQVSSVRPSRIWIPTKIREHVEKPSRRQRRRSSTRLTWVKNSWALHFLASQHLHPPSLACHRLLSLLCYESLSFPSYVTKVADSFGNNLSLKLWRETLTGSEPSLRSSARRLALSLRSTQKHSFQDPVLQSTFALTLLHLYEISHDQTHLDAAVKAAWQAVAALPPPRSGLPPITVLLIRNWMYSQRLVSRETGSVELLGRAVALGTSTLRISSECYPGHFAGRPVLTMELAECLFDRYRHLGDVKDLDDALSHVNAACEEEGFKDTHSRYVLGMLHLERYTRLGALDDLDEALYCVPELQKNDNQSQINEIKRRVCLDPDDIPSVHFLAMALAQRFTVVIDINDLNKAIEYGRKATQLCPLEHPHRSIYLSDLASLLHRRFAAQNDLADLEECVKNARVALKVARSGCYPFYPPQAVLGLALARLGASKGDAERIDKGISDLTAARRNFAGGLHLQSRIERDLSSALLIKFEHSTTTDDLDEAIHYATSALERTPTDDCSCASLAFELGRMLAIRYSLSHVDRDLALAINTLRSVSNGSGLASTRFRAAMEWVRAAAVSGGAAASLDALEVALDILPLVAWFGHRMVIQYKSLAAFSADVGQWAAGCAISCGRLQDMVTYLERGRNVLWSQLFPFQGGAREHECTTCPGSTSTMTVAASLASYIAERLHGPREPLLEGAIEDMKRQHPQVYRLMAELDSLCADWNSVVPIEGLGKLQASLDNIALDASLHRAAHQWTSLVSMMEALTPQDKDTDRTPGQDLFAKFLADSRGYIVLLNAPSIRCDALIIRRASDGRAKVDHVPLPDPSAEAARGWAESIRIGMDDLQRGALGVRDVENVVLIPILRNLWRTNALPILTHLSIFHNTSPPTRIWWHLSGPLAFLPIHAVGPYEGDAPGVPELVVSSYTPDLGLLAIAYTAPRAPFSMLVIGQPETPELSPLPAVCQELATIERACARISQDTTILVGSDATEYTVSRALSDRKHTWLHLSCHAHQDPSYPFHSAFYMHNGPLTLKKFVQIDLTGVQFAFLSACLTSAGGARLPDEYIHLATGMQFAGVRSVVATLWSVGDRAAAFVTDRFYGAMMKEGAVEPDVRDAAQALHDAVLEMKAAGKSMVFWIPFIHVGI